jgi:hypothetical protein
MLKVELYQNVSLTRNVPEANLRSGDVALLLDYVAHPTGGEEGVVLEIFNALGESIAVFTVAASNVALLRADQVPAVRTLA